MSKRANGEGTAYMIGGDRRKWGGSFVYTDSSGLNSPAVVPRSRHSLPPGFPHG